MRETEIFAPSLDEAMELYKQTVYGLAVSQLRLKSEADDVFQEVFLTYFRKKPQCPNEQALRAWLVRTTLNLCRRSNKSIWNTRVDKQEKAGEELTVEFLSKEENEVYTAVRSLKEKYRVPVWLYYFEEMTEKDIADVLGLSAGAVKMRLSRARKMLKKRLEGEYFE
ncbi:MAG: sigma-70 family RNA polymerase sigma factor [Ruminococcus sp.]|nr:sigma-70 family RNA polymerase sigma factor [Ruminococcus sp.]MBR4622873.1 sigma-70 family RNA polymerase sigma factor [Ruminococcus sp.]